MSESAVSAKVRLGLVWRETGAVRNARPNRSLAASTRKRTKCKKDAKPTDGFSLPRFGYDRVESFVLCNHKVASGGI